MNPLQELRSNLATVIDEEGRRHLDREEARERERREVATLRAAFDRVASGWLEQVVPRLQMLVELLPTTGTVEWTNAGWCASASFPSNPEFPVVASLTIRIRPVDGYRAGRVEIEPLLIPMLQGHPSATAREFGLGAPAVSEISRFLDQGVVAFARAYLRVRDPESPYQTTRHSRREAEVSHPPAAIEEPALTV
jgi:hypothetical protein